MRWTSLLVRAIKRRIRRIKLNIYPLLWLGGPFRASIKPFSSCDMSGQIRLVEGRYPGQQIHSLWAGARNFHISIRSGNMQIRDSEVYFYWARINLQKLSGTAKDPVEPSPGQRGATVLTHMRKKVSSGNWAAFVDDGSCMTLGSKQTMVNWLAKKEFFPSSKASFSDLPIHSWPATRNWTRLVNMAAISCREN